MQREVTAKGSLKAMRREEAGNDDQRKHSDDLSSGSSTL